VMAWSHNCNYYASDPSCRIFKEKLVTTSVIPIMEGEVRDARYVSGGIQFTNLDHLTDGTLVPGNPSAL